MCGMGRRIDTVTATVIVDGVPFRWWIFDGPAQLLLVAHPAFGTRTETLRCSPQLQAREIGEAMLEHHNRRLH
jgi:hypothetical protein